MQERIGRYDVIKVLARGPAAAVYLGRDDKLNRDVAIKVIETDSEHNDLRERFQREVKAIATLEHPSIIQLFDYSDADSQVLYLVMEYIPGQTLYELVEKRGPSSEQVALCVAREVTSAIQHAHHHRVIHRDIKPSNVLVHEGRVVLVDFGGVKLLLPNELTKTQAIGTPGFMAPEQFEGRRVDERTDIFAVGALMYNLTTANLPYYGTDIDKFYEAVRRGKYRDPRDYQPLLTPGFCDLLGDCLALKQSGRVSSATKLLERIDLLMEGHGVERPKDEILAYEEGDTRSPGSPHTRSMEALVRDLKVVLFNDLQAAIKERDRLRAQKIMRQLQVVVPLDPKSEGDIKEKRQVLKGSRSYNRALWFSLGAIIGAASVTTAGLWLLEGHLHIARWILALYE